VRSVGGWCGKGILELAPPRLRGHRDWHAIVNLVVLLLLELLALYSSHRSIDLYFVFISSLMSHYFNSTTCSIPEYSSLRSYFSWRCGGMNRPPKKCLPLYSAAPRFGAVKLRRTSGSKVCTVTPSVSSSA
jgi:hypothetical protein